MHGPSFLVVAGSLRGLRRSPAIAAWVAQVGREATQANFDIVDLAALDLHLDDEPNLPAKGPYVSDSTRRWSARVAAAAGVVVVSPQYNWGYPAGLKNAVDHLYSEWSGKPVLIVTYGGRGGDKCSAQLHEVFTGLHAVLAAPAAQLRLTRERIEADDGVVDPALEFANQRPQLVAGLQDLVSRA